MILKFLFWVLFKIRNHDLLYILAICDGDARRIKRHKKISNICYHHRVFLSSAASYISRVKAFTDGSKKKKKEKKITGLVAQLTISHDILLAESREGTGSGQVTSVTKPAEI